MNFANGRRKGCRENQSSCGKNLKQRKRRNNGNFRFGGLGSGMANPVDVRVHNGYSADSVAMVKETHIRIIKRENNRKNGRKNSDVSFRPDQIFLKIFREQR
jgi:hypothetical protein